MRYHCNNSTKLASANYKHMKQACRWSRWNLVQHHGQDQPVKTDCNPQSLNKSLAYNPNHNYLPDILISDVVVTLEPTLLVKVWRDYFEEVTYKDKLTLHFDNLNKIFVIQSPCFSRQVYRTVNTHLQQWIFLRQKTTSTTTTFQDK